VKSPVRCSVVIPTYNWHAYIRQAVASIRMQNMDDIEIIVIDDGSTDDTPAWLAREAEEDPNVTAIVLGGAGPSIARNAAISVAKGRWIAFLDADDLWWPGKLERQIAHLEQQPEIAFSFTDYLHVDPAGGLHGTCFGFWKPRYASRTTPDYAPVPDAELEILSMNVVGTSTVVASARALQNANGFAARSRSAEDWDLWLRLAKGGPVACSSSVTMSYLMRPTSVTQNRSTRIEAMRQIAAPYAARRDGPGRLAWRSAMARIEVAEAERARLGGARWPAAKSHFRALIHRPDLRTARAGLADLAAALGARAGA